MGETDDGLNAYFCACIDGFQRGVPITHSDFLELKDHDPNLPTWDKVELLIEYASILEAKAASRGGTKPQWKSQQVDQVRRQEGAEIAALAYTNRHLLIARAKRSRSVFFLSRTCMINVYPQVHLVPLLLRRLLYMYL